jgi:hypothetical protein
MRKSSVVTREAYKKLLELTSNDKPYLNPVGHTNEWLVETLQSQGYTYDRDTFQWRLRKRQQSTLVQRPQLKKREIVLVRLLGQREVLQRDLENFVLAMEIIGYEVTETSKPVRHEGTSFVRIYLQLGKG